VTMVKTNNYLNTDMCKL